MWINSGIVSTIVMVVEKLSREEKGTIKTSQDHLEHTIMQQISRKTKTKSRIKEMEDLITEIEKDATMKNLEEKAMIEILEISMESLTVPADYAQKLHTQAYLDAQSSRSIF